MAAPPRDVGERAPPVVERMAEADLAAVLAIEEASLESSHWDEAQLRGELSRTWAFLWVSRLRPMSPPISFLATWLVQDELHVLNIATHPMHRRGGHARALMDHALAFACERGVRMLLLEVRRSNAAAIGLYRKLGFAAIGLRERYYGDDEDAVEMVLRLDPSSGAVIPSRDEVRV